MLHLSIEELKAEVAFVEEAASHFALNPLHWTYGTLQPGSLLALRWGADGDGVVVVKLSANEPLNYMQVIPKLKE